MQASDVTHTGLEGAVHRDENTGYAEYGFIINGEFIPFLQRKLGHLDTALTAAAEREASHATEQPSAEQPQPTQPTQ